MKKLIFTIAMVCAFGLCASAQDKPKKEKAPKDKQETVDCCNKHKEHQCCDSSKVNGNSEGHAHQNNGNHNGQNKDHQNNGNHNGQNKDHQNNGNHNGQNKDHQNNGNHNGQNKDHQNNGNHNGQNKEGHPKAGVKPGMK